MQFNLGDIVTHSDPFHTRGASIGAIELITEQGWYQVFWEEDGDKQITPAFRTFEAHELKLCLTENFMQVSEDLSICSEFGEF